MTFARCPQQGSPTTEPVKSHTCWAFLEPPGDSDLQRRKKEGHRTAHAAPLERPGPLGVMKLICEAALPDNRWHSFSSFHRPRAVSTAVL